MNVRRRRSGKPKGERFTKGWLTAAYQTTIELLVPVVSGNGYMNNDEF